MNIDGLGEETIDLFYANNLLNNIADIYDLRKEDIARLEGLGDKSAENILAGIDASKQVPWSRVLFALGIRMVGETTAKKIAKRFPSLDMLQAATKEELIAIDDVGEQIAENKRRTCEAQSRMEAAQARRKISMAPEVCASCHQRRYGRSPSD